MFVYLKALLYNNRKLNQSLYSRGDITMIRTLIIEDEPDILDGIVELIDWEVLGFEIIGTCRDGKSGYDFILNHQPELVITDIKMPFMTGLELLEKIKELNQMIQVVILTGYENFEYAKQSINLGAVGFVSKLSLFEDLTSILTSIKKKLSVNSNDKDSIKETILLKNVVLEAYLNHHLINEDKKKEYQSFFFQSIGIKIESNSQVINELMTTIEQTLLPDSHSLFYFKMRINLFCICIYHSNREHIQLNQEKFLSILHSFLKKESTIQPFKYYLMISDPYEGVDGCLQTFDDINYIQTRRKFLEGHVILYKSNFMKLDFNTNFEKLPQIENAILSYFDSMNYQLAKDSVEQWIDLVFNHQQLTIDQMKQTCISLITLIIWKLEENLTLSEKSKKIRDDLLDFSEESSLEQLNYRFQDLYLQCLIILKKSNTSSQKSNLEVLETARNYIENHILENISLTNIAYFSYMSPTYFSSLFKKTYGENFSEFVIGLKMKKAYELLESGVSVAQVSQILGYSEVKSFRRMFKKIYGMTPNSIKKGSHDENAS
jgi:two-component system, response regulator YesN